MIFKKIIITPKKGKKENKKGKKEKRKKIYDYND